MFYFLHMHVEYVDFMQALAEITNIIKSILSFESPYRNKLSVIINKGIISNNNYLTIYATVS